MNQTTCDSTLSRSTNLIDGGTPHVPSPVDVGVRGFERLVVSLARWQRRYTERLALRDLSARLRRDAGLSDAAIARELEKPFWRD